jgi:hypothetical protein
MKPYLKFLLGLVLLSLSCGRDLNSPQGVAEEFVDQHYVNIDLQKAKAYAVSVALAKIDDEIRLTTGQQIDASTQKPKVNYKLLEKHEAEKRSTYLYEGQIRSDDGTSFVKKWLITTRLEGTQWRVSNFTESD